MFKLREILKFFVSFCPNFDGGAISGNPAEARKCRPYIEGGATIFVKELQHQRMTHHIQGGLATSRRSGNIKGGGETSKNGQQDQRFQGTIYPWLRGGWKAPAS